MNPFARPSPARIALAAATLLIGAFAIPAAPASAAPEPAPPTGAPEGTGAESVLVFSKTAEFRHDSIPDGIAALQELGAEHGLTVDATEDGAEFTEENLARYAAVVFLSTTGDVLDGDQQAAFERYLEAGGGYLGVHAAADTEYDWDFYGGLAGAWFESHPEIQPATVQVEDHEHPATAHLPATWERVDEWYNYRTNPRPQVRVLASLDESSYQGGTMDGDHPIAWCQEYQGGRAFYTGGGHTSESFTDPDFRAHLLGGLQYAAGMTPADCSPTDDPPDDPPTTDPPPAPGDRADDAESAALPGVAENASTTGERQETAAHPATG